MPYVVLIIKVIAMCVFAIAVRGTLPRYRFDQFTQLNWKHFIFIWLSFLILSCSYLILLY